MLDNAGLEVACRFHPSDHRFDFHRNMYDRAARTLTYLQAHLPEEDAARRRAARTMLEHLKSMFDLARGCA